MLNKMKLRNYPAKHMNTFNKPSVQPSKKSSLLISAELQDMKQDALEGVVEAVKCEHLCAVELMSNDEITQE